MTREEPSPDLAALDRALDAVHFEPRTSLGPELAGRAARGEEPMRAVHPWQSFAVRSALALVGVAAAAALVVGVTPPPSHVDLCCQDLDGGRDGNDGMVLSLDPRGRVTQLLLYEDLDGSHSRTDADVVRFVRGSELELADPAAADSLRTLVRCCEDLDGGGVADDGVMVMGRADEIRFAALVEIRGPRKTLR